MGRVEMICRHPLLSRHIAVFSPFLPPLLMKFFATILLCIFFTAVFSQQEKQPEIPVKNLRITKTAAPIKVDALASEAAWSEAETLTGFWKKFPVDDGPARFETEVKILYGTEYLYVFFTAHDSGKAFITSLRRDVGHDGNDGMAVILDPQNEKASGYFFVLNAYGTQSEGLIGPQVNGADFSWDNKWYTAVKRFPTHWTAEMAIPFKTLRYDASKKEWAVNFLRVDMQNNQYSLWNRVPVNFASYDLGYTGKLLWNEPPPAPGSNLVFIPYVIGQATTNQQQNIPLRGKANAGFDAKVALGSAMNLDLTVNPDFAQVEVDRQVTNLTRFSIFFPERRNFFLENADLFSSYGIPPIRPFYSRRIGLDKNGRPIPIIAGARLTGNVTKTTRIGVFNMQTGRKDDYSPENFTAVSVNQKLLSRSFIKGYFLNREGFLSAAEKQADPLAAYGRNAGLELNYTDEEGKWQGWAGYHHSYKQGLNDRNKYLSFGGGYSVRNFETFIDFGSIGTNFYTDMGFLERIENYDAARDTTIRLGYKSLYAEATYRIYPKKGGINQHAFNVENFTVINPDNSFNEHNLSLTYEVQLKNTSNFSYSFNTNRVQLLYPVSFTDDVPIPAARYVYNNHNLEYNSDFRKPLNVALSIGSGQFYNGHTVQVESNVNYRIIPHVNLAVGFNYYNLRFPQPYGKTSLFLVSPQVDVNFTTALFWTTFLQFNTQGNNVNINSRFQWRFKPMSDLFLVYTDNYFTTPFLKNKNRALVAKFQYWLNL